MAEYEVERPWNVFLKGRITDTVFYPESMNQGAVLRDLVHEHSYDPEIEVYEEHDYDRKYEVQLAIWRMSHDKRFDAKRLREIWTAMQEALAQEAAVL